MTSSSAATDRAGDATWRRRVGTFLHAAFAEFVLLLALFTLAAGITITLANSLPGIAPFEDVRAMLIIALAFAPALVIVLWAIELGILSTARPTGSVRGSIALARRRTRVWVRIFVNHLGLAPCSRSQIARILLVGLLAGVLSYAVTLVATILMPELAATAGPDARRDAIASAPPWVPALYFAIYAPAWEEVWYRGPLLLAVAAISWWGPRPAMNRVLVLLALAVSSVIFGTAHLDWSVLNAVTATMSGLLYGGAALLTRSLWPAVIAHAVTNAAVGISWVLA